MTRLYNEPSAFADEMIEGFAAASARWVTAVPGGVVRSTRGAEDTVALVIGGGSGHYPAFGGLVGPGLAHGAAMGNLFASPSAQQVYSVAKTADQGKGVLLSYGNYAGDVLNFTAAQERLRAAGYDVRTVVVTDDIWSAPPERAHERRGVAGDFVVFKVAGAAAEAGAALDDVERVANKANDRMRSFGVAFDGCTFPGAEGPLFTVRQGRMAVGLGIHGEPGIDEVDVPTADGLAELFVSRLLEEVPDGVTVDGARVAPVLNGLGTVKYEELFVVYRTIHRLLVERGIVVTEPDVGEFCTSLDMAGCSLTLVWLDDELEQLWRAPVDTPAYRKGAVAPRQRTEVIVAGAVADDVPPATDASKATAQIIGTAFTEIADAIDDAADELGRLDAVAGDGDHGIGMQRGVQAGRDAALTAIKAGAGAETTMQVAAEAWGDRAGGTSGAIWATMLGAFAGALGNSVAVSRTEAGAGVAAACEAVTSFGKAKVGDKTMIDAIVPFTNELRDRIESGDSLVDAWSLAAGVAGQAAQDTSALAATLGRAKSHGDRSVGTPDPGAVSFALICSTVADVLRQTKRRTTSDTSTHHRIGQGRL